MDKTTHGWINGFLGVLIFSGSLPATRAAVMDFDPVFLTVARAVIAALLALVLLGLFRAKRPERDDLLSLCIVAGGVVIGFPLLTALALQHVTAAHSIVFIGLLPLATAIFAVLRGGERPRAAFWVFSCLGSSIVAGFAMGTGRSTSPLGDGLMIAAVIVCALGYAEGAKLSRRLGGWQVISWALVLSLPFMAPLLIATAPSSFATVGVPAWIGLSLCVRVQHADRLLLLVPRPGSGRHRCGQSVTTAAALLPGLTLAATLLGERGEPHDARSNRRSRGVRDVRKKVGVNASPAPAAIPVRAPG